MNFSETLKLALSQILAHKLRSFLTLLGMIIGVTAFMVVWSLIQGFNKYVDEKIAGIGSNSFSVRRFTFEDFKDIDTIAAAQRRNKDLTFDELEFVVKQAQTVGKIGARANPNSAEIKRGAEKMQGVRVDGATPNVIDIENLDVVEGRFFSDSENEGASRVAYVGKDVADRLVPFGSPVGAEIYIRGIPYKIIGVQKAKGTVFGMPQDSFVTVPIKTYASQFGALIRGRGLYFLIQPKSEKLFKDSVEEVRLLMRIKRRVTVGEKDNFGIVTPDAITGLKDRVFRTISVVVLVIPSIALIVSAIVIMNIMLVAVTERTKEIGIRKSLGARQADILRQFMLESATLSAIGGLMGLILAFVLGYIITVSFFPTSISLFSAFIAIGVSGAIGILAGLFPAWRAARLDPIEALRAD